MTPNWGFWGNLGLAKMIKNGATGALISFKNMVAAFIVEGTTTTNHSRSYYWNIQCLIEVLVSLLTLSSGTFRRL